MAGKKNASELEADSEAELVSTSEEPAGLEETGLDPQKAYRFKGKYRYYLHTAKGRRKPAVKTLVRGKYSRFKLPGTTLPGGVAVDASIRAAAARQAGRGKIQIEKTDLREKIRRHRSPYLICFVVDNSWSAHVEATLEKVKGVALSFLKDAGFQRDRVAMVTFYHSRSPQGRLILPPTNSHYLAARRLKEIPLSGSTPLPDAINLARTTLRSEYRKKQNVIPVLVLLTDGLPTAASKPGRDPYLELEAVCRLLSKEPFLVLVVDVTSGEEEKKSNCRQIAALTGGRYLKLAELTRRTLEKIIGNH